MPWPDEYVNSETGKSYSPHHEDERMVVYGYTPRWVLVKGGEGSGKSVLGIRKTLDRLRRGMSGIMVSPDFEHFKKSLWQEFRRWCPWDLVVKRQRYRASKDWEPSRPFAMTFYAENGEMVNLMCGGIDEPGAWEGPNVNFAHMDEMRRHRTAAALKVIDGRIRTPGPNGEPPQGWITTTPRKHWLYEFFGPVIKDKDGEDNDARADFKKDALTITLRLIDNDSNLAKGYVKSRRNTLTEKEARILMDAEWEDDEDVESFLPDITLFDRLKEELPELDPLTVIVIAADAGVNSDTFGLVGVSRHPTLEGHSAMRLAAQFKPGHDGLIDYEGTEDDPGPNMVIRKWCKLYNVIMLTYDPYQLHDMTQRLRRDSIVWCEPFDQNEDRLEADKQLLDMIIGKKFHHNGDPRLRQAVENADRKVDQASRKIRIVKRENGLKVDLLVATSMANYKIMEMNL